MNKKDEKSIWTQLFDKEHWILKLNVVIWALIFLFAYGVIFAVRYYGVINPKVFQITGDLLSTFTALFTTAVAVAWLSITIEKETRKTFIKQMENSIAEALLLNEDIIKDMPSEKKKKAISHIIHDLIGNNSQHIVDFINVNIDKAVLGWRSDFVYRTKLEKCLDIAQPALNYRLSQEISYTQNYSSQPTEPREIRIGFALKDEALDKWLKQDGVWFFREIIHDRFEGTDKQSAMDFIENILKFEFYTGVDEDNEKTVTISDANIKLHFDEKENKIEGIEINYPLSKDADKFFARICFLNNRKDRNFLVTLPTLTKKATIELGYDDKEFTVYGYDFFTHNSNSNITKSNRNGTCRFEIKDTQWLFPVSGIMFVWEETTPFKEVSQ